MDLPTEDATIPETLTGVAKDELLRMFRGMLEIRRFEELAARAYTRGKISGFLHLYIGQEAIAVGAAEAMRPGDRIVGTYRDHGFALALDPARERELVIHQWLRTPSASANPNSNS